MKEKIREASCASLLFFIYTVASIGFTKDSYEGNEGNGVVTIEVSVQGGINIHQAIPIRVISENIPNAANAATCKYNVY